MSLQRQNLADKQERAGKCRERRDEFLARHDLGLEGKCRKEYSDSSFLTWDQSVCERVCPCVFSCTHAEKERQCRKGIVIVR